MSIKRLSIYILPALLLVAASFGASVEHARAATDVQCYINPIAGGLWGTIDTVPKFLLRLVDLIFLIAVPIIVVCIIYGGLLFVMAGDNETQIAKARTVITWTLIGAGVLLGAKAIAMAVQATICSLDPSNSLCTAAPSSSGYTCT